MRLGAMRSKAIDTPPPDLNAEHAIVVFGAALDDAGRPGIHLRARLQQALRLAERYPSAVLVLSGGPVAHAKPEAEAMAEWLIDRKVAPERIVREPAARYTLDNAERVAPLLRALGVRTVDLVTEAFHMSRSEAVMRGALTARGLTVDLRRSPAPDATLEPGRAAKEQHKKARDLRTQAGLHGLEHRIPYRAGPAPQREWWA